MRRFAQHTFAIEVIGWYGMVAVLVAYGLVNLSILPSNSLLCILLNLTGSVGLLIAAAFKRVPQLVVLNIVWAMIAIIELCKALVS